MTLLPGCQYSFSSGEGGGFRFVTGHPDQLSIESGETKDLGTLTIDKEGKVTRQAASGPPKAPVPSTESSVPSTQPPGRNNSASGKSKSSPIRGRVVDSDGKPVAGVVLRGAVFCQRKGRVGRRMEARRQGHDGRRGAILREFAGR